MRGDPRSIANVASLESALIGWSEIPAVPSSSPDEIPSVAVLLNNNTSVK